MKEQVATLYTCDVCNTNYHNKETAALCEEYGKYLKDFDTDNVYKWYKLHYHDLSGGQTLFIFVEKIKLNTYERQCLYTTIDLYSFENNEYFESKPNSWEIVEILTVSEAYERYRILPITSNSHKINKLPNDIKEEINKILSKEIEQRLKTLTVEDVLNDNEIRYYLLKDLYKTNRRRKKELSA